MISNLSKIALNTMPMEGFVKTEKEIIFYYGISPSSKSDIFLRKAKITKKENGKWSETKECLLMSKNKKLDVSKWKKININTEELRLA